ncbi:MAG: diaminopimelate decarboxylase [Kiritimatiellae bacterium]|nr:diaminopimelate decarboxylase [Kiritimatiellia bacterium]
MNKKRLPCSKKKLLEILRRFPTPFHLYDEKGIRANARRLLKSFSWNPGFREYFAVKATPNPFIMKILQKEGFGYDCSSLAELVLAERVGASGEWIMFTSNDTPASEFVKARELGAIINLDDITHLPFLERHAGLPSLLCFRYNPGPLRRGNTFLGHPEEAKYGLTKKQLFEAYRIARDKGVKRFGIHTMLASNEMRPEYFVETADMLFRIVAELSRQLSIRFEFVNIGGGIGIPYKPDQSPVDIGAVSEGIRQRYVRWIEQEGLAPLGLFMECGRFITGPYGYLVARVLHIKDTYRKFAGLDACMANLMRPAMYGAYHHITVLGKSERIGTDVYDVTGSLCENNDKFAIQRRLPTLRPGDVVVIHDTGAHGHAMGFNYNGKLRSAELLLREDGSVVQIRRAETLDDYFATLDFQALAHFQV